MTSVKDLRNTQYGGLKNCVKTVTGTTAKTCIGTKKQEQRTLQLLEHQTRVFEAMLQKSNETCTTVSFTPDAVTNTIDESLYNPEEWVTFLSYYRR